MNHVHISDSPVNTETAFDFGQLMNSTTEANCSEVLDSVSFDAFKPTLAQCFLLVITGYLIAKFQLLSASDLRGINAFVNYVGMPGIICVTLADADFTTLRWELVLGLFLCKLCVFVLVAGVSFRINCNVGLAGLLAVFCVHSNDLPVGNPLISALYTDHKQHMVKYLFLMPAMTMTTFVPIGLFMIEIYKVRRSLRSGATENYDNSLMWKTVLSKKGAALLMTSFGKSIPVVLATIIGITFSFSFGDKMLEVLHRPLKVVAATVPGCVLCALGFNMYRKERYLITSSVVPASILIMIRMFLTPLLMHTITNLLTNGVESLKLLTDFGLLYGIVSPATAIFQAGQEFRKPLAAMSVTLIISSFLSFPLSYIISRYTLGPTCELDAYIPILREVLFCAASFSLFCNAFVLFYIVWRNKHQRVPYTYIICLVITQIMTSSGTLLWSLQEENPWTVYYEMVLYFGGETLGLIWMGIIAFLLISVDRYPYLAQKSFTFILGAAIIIGSIVVTVMCCLIPHKDDNQVYVVGRARSKFQFLQLAVMTIIQGIVILITITFLLSYYKRKEQSWLVGFPLKSQFGIDNKIFYMDVENVTTTHFKLKRSSSTDLYSSLRDTEESNEYYQELHRKLRGQSTTAPAWTVRIRSLLVMLLIVVILKFVSNLYKLGNSKSLEVMVPLEFVQSSLFVGQGLFILLTFGIDVRTMTIGLIKWWRLIRHGKEQIFTDAVDQKSDEALFCNKFKHFYFKKCFQDLAKDRNWKGVVYKESFWGHQLVDWLIEEGLAQDDVEAEELGEKLLLGDQISHVSGVHHFHDAPYLYFFNSSDRSSNKN